MIAATQLKPSKTPVSRLAPNDDFCHVTECLTAGEINVLKRVRSLVETEVAPVITDFGARDPFLFELVPGITMGLELVFDFERGGFSRDPPGWIARLFKHAIHCQSAIFGQRCREKLDSRETVW